MKLNLNTPLFLVFFFMGSIMLIQSGYALTPVNSCSTPLDTAGETYRLTQNVNSLGTCFTVGANNIVLDGAGYTITYAQSGSGYGVDNQGGYDNITLKNLDIVQGNPAVSGSHAIYVSGMSQSNITDNLINLSGSDGLGIYIIASSNNTISNNKVSNITGSTGNSAGNTGTGGSGGSAYGIYLSASQNNTVASNNISYIVGGVGGGAGNYGTGGAGGSSYGIYITSSDNNNILANEISNLNGSKGGSTGSSSRAGLGGSSHGIYLFASQGNNLTSNNMSFFNGGEGGNVVNTNVGGAGGSSYGIYLSSSQNNTLISNNMQDFIAGGGGYSIESSGVPGFSSAIYVDSDDAYSNRITETKISGLYAVPDAQKLNRIDDAPIIFMHNQSYANISGFNITTPTAPLTVGSDSFGILLAGLNNSLIEDNIVSGGFRGPTGYSLEAWFGNGGPGGASYGIYLSQSKNNSLVSNNISAINGGFGGNGGRCCTWFFFGGNQPYTCTGGLGGTSYGIYLSPLSNNTLLSNKISGIQGGMAGSVGAQCNGGPGGASYGIYSSPFSENILALNTISNIAGGSEGSKGTFSNPGAGGNSSALYFIESSNNLLVSNNVSNIAGGSGAISSASFGLHISSSNSSIFLNTLIGISSVNGYGVYLNNSKDNNIAGGSIVSRTGYEYYLSDSGAMNNFTITNFTSQRKIYFNDAVSWFNYRNDIISNIWLNTRLVAAGSINRTLLLWSQAQMRWNDTNGTAGLTAMYNLTGLLAGTQYTVTNATAYGITSQTLSTNALGELSFAIALNGDTEIVIQQVVVGVVSRIVPQSPAWKVTRYTTYHGSVARVTVSYR